MNMYHDDDEGSDSSSSSSDEETRPDDGAGMYDQSEGMVSSTPREEADDGEADGDDETDDTPSVGFDLLADDDGGPEQATGTFYVKHTEDIAATLHEVNTGQIFTLVENPDLERHEILEASLVAQPPMQVSYLIDEIESRRTVPVETSSEEPTRQVQEMIAKMDVGEAVAIKREGEGEIHILCVEPDRTEQVVEELQDDEMTYKNAARYGVGRVEIRSDADEGLVSIRYLP